MQVAIAYADATQQAWLRITVPEPCTVEQAIIQSGILRQFPDIDLTEQKVGIFGRLVKLEAPVSAGDRIEIYRPITADPMTVPRRDGVEEDD